MWFNIFNTGTQYSTPLVLYPYIVLNPLSTTGSTPTQQPTLCSDCTGQYITKISWSAHIVSHYCSFWWHSSLVISNTVFVHLAVDAFLFHHIRLPEEYIIKHNIAYSIIIITYMCTAYKVDVDVDLNMMLL